MLESSRLDGELSRIDGDAESEYSGTIASEYSELNLSGHSCHSELNLSRASSFFGLPTLQDREPAAVLQLPEFMRVSFGTEFHYRADLDTRYQAMLLATHQAEIRETVSRQLLDKLPQGSTCTSGSATPRGLSAAPGGIYRRGAEGSVATFGTATPRGLAPVESPGSLCAFGSAPPCHAEVRAVSEGREQTLESIQKSLESMIPVSLRCNPEPGAAFAVLTSVPNGNTAPTGIPPSTAQNSVVERAVSKSRSSSEPPSQHHAARATSSIVHQSTGGKDVAQVATSSSIPVPAWATQRSTAAASTNALGTGGAPGALASARGRELVAAAPMTRLQSVSTPQLLANVPARQQGIPATLVMPSYSPAIPAWASQQAHISAGPSNVVLASQSQSPRGPTVTPSVNATTVDRNPSRPSPVGSFRTPLSSQSVAMQHRSQSPQALNAEVASRTLTTAVGRDVSVASRGGSMQAPLSCAGISRHRSQSPVSAATDLHRQPSFAPVHQCCPSGNDIAPHKSGLLAGLVSAEVSPRGAPPSYRSPQALDLSPRVVPGPIYASTSSRVLRAAETPMMVHQAAAQSSSAATTPRGDAKEGITQTGWNGPWASNNSACSARSQGASSRVHSVVQLKPLAKSREIQEKSSMTSEYHASNSSEIRVPNWCRMHPSARGGA